MGYWNNINRETSYVLVFKSRKYLDAEECLVMRWLAGLDSEERGEMLSQIFVKPSNSRKVWLCGRAANGAIVGRVEGGQEGAGIYLGWIGYQISPGWSSINVRGRGGRSRVGGGDSLVFHPSPETGVGAWPRSSHLHEVILQSEYSGYRTVSLSLNHRGWPRELCWDTTWDWLWPWPLASLPLLLLAAWLAACLWVFFLLFILLFWNQILICLSVRLRFRASSHLRRNNETTLLTTVNAGSGQARS